PFEPLETRRFSQDEVEAWAERSRRHFDIGSAPVINIREFLAAQGFQVFSVPLGAERDDLSGLYFQHPELGPVIAVNEDRAYTRRPFTMAHELAHGLFHYQYPVVLCRGGSRDALERFADQFAAQFLAPTESLLARLDDMQVRSVSDPRQVVHLSRYFGVSYEAMRWRLRAQRKLQDADDPRWKIAPLKMARQLGFTVSDYEFGKRPLLLEDRFPRDYLALALQGVQDGQLSLRRAAEMLDVSYLELEELMENDETALEEEIEEVYV
ncbi:MAG: ImmA/IrrE family metallo-endopeptidase, partial [Chloroflexota bacterium]